jgi:predicted RNA-binding Zn ribbon-like protein
MGHTRVMLFTEQVEGALLPAAISGHPALELCNTWAGWNSPPGTGGDYLHDYQTLAVWARERAGLSTEETQAACRAAEDRPEEAAGLLREVRRLRGHLYQLLTDHETEADVRHVARLAQEAQGALRLERNGTGGMVWRLGRDNPLRLPLLAAARAAGDLVTSPDRQWVHACPGDECGWVFLDPRGRRKWCIMSVCGNRAKARAYAQRKASADSARD